ncbi:MAG: HAD family phosphatase [Acidobacteria bacterium]|nr:HAD family phosphatase [Acidobacteriota bacterium]
MSALDAIIFDFDGVIADSERLHLVAFQQALASTPLVLSDEAYYAHYLGFDDLGVLRQLAADQRHALDAATLEALVTDKGRCYDALAAAGEMLFPGAAEFIRTASASVPIAVASGAQTHEIEDVLGRAGLGTHFLAIIGADQTPASKPAPDPYLEAFARLGRITGRTLAPARTVAIEDSRWGLESATAAGLRTVAVTNTYPAEALAGHAELVVAGLHALDVATLERLCGRARAS